MIDRIAKTLSDIRKQKPLILSVTNFVTMDFVANCLLSIGAAPIMSVCEEELEELVQIASAVYINIGTLDNNFISFAKKALALAEKYKKPLVFDPVGAGATNIRTQTAQSILPFSNILRGNASEIMALGGSAFTTHGVEATHTTNDAEEIATRLALKNHTTVIVSGPVDFITNGHKSEQVAFGSHLMQRVTGMGCAMTAVVAACKAIVEDSFAASSIAAHYFALCAEVVSKNHPYPGTFKTAFLDQLHSPDYMSMKELYDQRK
jgi:hydroxyethylthiazole kinase